MDSLDKEVSPEDVEELEGSQEAVEDVVGGEHLDKEGSVEKGGVEDPGGVDTTPGNYPRHRE